MNNFFFLSPLVLTKDGPRQRSINFARPSPLGERKKMGREFVRHATPEKTISDVDDGIPVSSRQMGKNEGHNLQMRFFFVRSTAKKGHSLSESEFSVVKFEAFINHS